MKINNPLKVMLLTHKSCCIPNTSISRLIVSLFFLATSITYSQQTTWRLDNVTFNSGATATGSFDFDASTSTYSNINIAIANSPNYGTAVFNNSISASSNASITQFFTQIAPDLTGTPTLILAYTQALDSGNNTIDIVSGISSFLATCNTADCVGGGIAPFEDVVSGRVIKNTPPMAVCQNITITLDNSGNASITPSNIDGGSTDDTPGFALALDKTDFACTDLGANLVTLTITDINGLSDSCTATVTIVDNNAPELTSVTDVTTNTVSGECFANVTVPSPVVSDNCSFTITNSITGTSDASGLYPLGTTLVEWTATDPSGNSLTFVQTLQVNDNEAPAIVCSADITVSSDLGMCNANVTIPSPTVTDNCTFSSPSLINDFNGTSNASGIYPVGTTTVTWTATDVDGNSASCTQLITVNDTEAPTISCPAQIITDIDPGICSATVTVPSPTFSDNCSVTVTNDYTGTADASGSYPEGLTRVTWTATDASGNSTSCVQEIIVNDPEPPVANCSSDIMIANDPGMCNAMVTVPAPTVSDNCLIASVINDYTGTSDASGTYPLGTTVVTWTVTDDGGRTSTCTQQITVNNSIAPTISCAIDITVNNDAGQCNAMVNVPTPSASDDCSAVTLTNDFNGTSDASGTYPIGTTIVTWTAMDTSGNSSSCVQSIIVTESVVPTISCPADINLSCPGQVNFASPTTSDDCGFPAVPTTVPGFTLFGSFGDSTYFISDAAMTGPEAFALAQANNYDLLTINSMDENDYIYQAQQSLPSNVGIFLGYNDLATEGSFAWQSGQPNFFENWRPGNPNSALGEEDYVVFNVEKWYDVSAALTFPVVIEFHDYSSGRPIQVAGLPPGSVFTGTTVNTFFSKDIGGNTNTCSFTITSEDTTAPTISCSPDIVVNVNPNACTAGVSVPMPTLGDDCGTTLIPTTSRVPYDFNTQRELVDTLAFLSNMSTTAEDVVLRISFSGDHDDFGAQENFILSGPDNVMLLNMSAELCTRAERDIIVPMSTWNSWITTYGSDLIFTLQGKSNVHKDMCPDSPSYFQIDVISQGSLLLTNDFTGLVGASGIYPIGTTTVSWTVTDLAGNSSTCTQTVTVNETTAPNISCPANISVNNDSGLCSAVVNYQMPTVIDNCTLFTNSLQNVLNNFNQSHQLVTSLIPSPFDFAMDGDNGVNGHRIDDGLAFTEIGGGADMYDEGNLIGTDLNAGPISYSDNSIIASSAFGTNGAFFTRKVKNMWLLAADLDNVNSFNITGSLGADGNGAADGFTSTITVGGVNYNLFVKRVREITVPSFFESDPSVNHLVIIPENSNATQNFSNDTSSDQHQVTGLSGTTRMYYLLFAGLNSGLVDNASMEAIATSFITNMFIIPGNLQQTAGLPSGSAFPFGTTTNTFVATDASGNQSTCSFTVTVSDTSGNCNVFASPKAYLQGSALNSTIATDGLMRDDLRVGNYIPLNTPYSDGATIDSSVLSVTGADAIVDWVWVELRDATTNTMVIDSQSALLQRDSDVVALDGTSPLAFNQPVGNYHVAIKHRNHLGIMSSSAIGLNSSATLMDFTDGSTATFGTYAQTSFGMPTGVQGMWSGNANGDNEVIFLNTGAESVQIKQRVLDVSAVESPFEASVFYKPQGYYDEDVNMDGELIFLNAGNELLLIKDNVLNHPGNAVFNSVFYRILEQLP